MLTAILLAIIAAQAWYIYRLRKEAKVSRRYATAMLKGLKETMK